MDQQTIILAAAILLTLIMGLVAAVVIQQQRIKKLQQPKYGFLGKPIMPAIAMAIMLGGIAGGVFLVNQQPGDLDPTASAGEIEINVAKECVSAQNNKVRYKLSAIPSEDGQEYGMDDSYTLFWSLNLNTSNYVSVSERNISAANPSEITVDLPVGNNSLILLVIKDGEEGSQSTHTETFSIASSCS